VTGELNFNEIAERFSKFKDELSKRIVGQDDLVELIFISLISEGHILIEGLPGLAKTLTAKLAAKAIGSEFSRIQFTPDLMPSDILGTMVFNQKKSEFDFKAGPIFSNLILIDEINRSPAKTQAALFEVMEEGHITIDGKKHQMEKPFFVLATQNPIDQEGTYRLPEAQLDRFLFRVKLKYPEFQDEVSILKKHLNKSDFYDFDQIEIILTKKEIESIQKIVDQVHVKEELIEYIARIVQETRNDPSIYVGASPRAGIAILNSSKVLALINARDFVTPDDVQFLAKFVLNHRLIISPEKEMEGIDAEMIINQLIQRIEVPR
jgi:MoxR-like ATPase